MSPPLSCPVRGCALALHREERAWTCTRGHVFDVARSGYVNLLQPQDRRSLRAGDSRDAVEARSRLLSASVGRPILDAFVARAADLRQATGSVVADLGCGSGDVLGSLAGRTSITGVGIDLSAFAVDRAARRFPTLTWIVANADRRLPLPDGAVALILSVHARRHPMECARVLPAGGHLLVAVPAPDDLIELREVVQGQRVERDRVADLIAEHASTFDLVDRRVAREHNQLDASQLRDLLRGTYRGERASLTARVQALDGMAVTSASDIILLRRR